MAAFDLATVVPTLHGTVLLLCVPAYFTNFFKLEAMTGDLAQIDSMLAALSLDVHAELKDRISPLFKDNKIVLVADDSYAEKPANVIESETFQEAIRTFAATHSGQLFEYGRVLSLREAVVFWRRWLAWCVLALVAVEIVALLAVVLLPRFLPAFAAEVFAISLIPLAALIAGALFSILLLRTNNDRLAKIRVRLTSLPK